MVIVERLNVFLKSNLNMGTDLMIVVVVTI